MTTQLNVATPCNFFKHLFLWWCNRLIWPRAEFMLQLLKVGSFHCTIHIMVYVAGFILLPLNSCRTIIMGFISNVETFLFMHVEMTWLLLSPSPFLISLYCYVDGKKIVLFNLHRQFFGILFDVYNTLWHYQQNCYNILLTCQSNMYWSCKFFFSAVSRAEVAPLGV